ncbi:hypothetical protein [Methylobacterium oryzisoli]|uniref:hypothetical protein n=1 Tax=Methylobacterium oryzisoli TaxID=3385502 RepID=UPI003892757C
MRSLVVTVRVCLSGAAFGAEAVPSLEAGSSYFEARISLALLGWEPQRVTSAGRECSGGGVKSCEMYEEMIGCSGLEQHRCQAIWRKDHSEFYIDTIGVDPLFIRMNTIRYGSHGGKPASPLKPSQP